MKPSRKKRKQMKEKANANGGLVSTENKKKKRCEEEKKICFHLAPPVYIKYYRYQPRYSDTLMLDTEALNEFLRKKLKERKQPSYDEPAESYVCQAENGSYACSVCRTKFSKKQWEQMNALVEFLNEDKGDKETVKEMYKGLCPVRYYRTPEGELVTEKVEEEVEIPWKIEISDILMRRSGRSNFNKLGKRSLGLWIV